MGYDCSITKRKGCNYCIRSKEIPFTTGDFRWYIDDSKNELQADEISIGTIKINYCPICGRDLNIQ